MTTTNRSFTEIEQNQSSAYIIFNELLRHLDARGGHWSIEDKDLNEPPGTETAGQCWIVATGTGDWDGEDGNVAHYYNDGGGAAWYFYTPREGDIAWVKDESKMYYYTSGSAWAELVAP